MRVHIYYFPSNTASIAFIEPDTRKDVFSIILGRVARFQGTTLYLLRIVRIQSRKKFNPIRVFRQMA